MHVLALLRGYVRSTMSLQRRFPAADSQETVRLDSDRRERKPERSREDRRKPDGSGVTYVKV